MIKLLPLIFLTSFVFSKPVFPGEEVPEFIEVPLICTFANNDRAVLCMEWYSDYSVNFPEDKRISENFDLLWKIKEQNHSQIFHIFVLTKLNRYTLEFSYEEIERVLSEKFNLVSRVLR